MAKLPCGKQSASNSKTDYDRIKLYDEGHSGDEDRYDTIGDTSAGNLTVIGNLQDTHRVDDILFVVYTERATVDKNEKKRGYSVDFCTFGHQF